MVCLKLFSAVVAEVSNTVSSLLLAFWVSEIQDV